MPTVIVVGAGFGGIAAAVELTRNGFDDVTVLEASSELGGTWHHNRYPGAACDVPSHFYSLSYAQRGEWSRFCSPQAEILGYLQRTAREFDVERRVELGVRVTACHWDDVTCRWTVHTERADGRTVERIADAVVIATGQLHQPDLPRVAGLEDFAGRAFHSARWDRDYDLRGKRVAVIGTGASSVQFVPEIAPLVEQLTVFQRTGNWFLPRQNKDYAPAVRAMFRRVPALRRVFRAFLFVYMESLTAMVRHPDTLGWVGRIWSTLFMRGQLRDPEVRRRARPDYSFGCKRVLFSSAYLPALQRENVELVTDPIVAMTAAGPQTADGRVFDVDCVVYATGFRTHDFMFPMAVTGVGGRSLREAWAGGGRAHLGVSVAGFPSLFLMYGPNTNTSGGSIIFFLEAQARLLRQALELVRSTGAAAIDVHADVQQASDTALQQRFAGTAWTRCNSWYRNESGRIVTNWPGYMHEYAGRTRTLNPGEYRLVRRAPERAAATSPGR